MEKVKGIAELTPEAREQFYGALQAALREGSKQLIEVEHRRQEDAGAAGRRAWSRPSWPTA